MQYNNTVCIIHTGWRGCVATGEIARGATLLSMRSELAVVGEKVYTVNLKENIIAGFDCVSEAGATRMRRRFL